MCLITYTVPVMLAKMVHSPSTEPLWPASASAVPAKSMMWSVTWHGIVYVSME